MDDFFLCLPLAEDWDAYEVYRQLLPMGLSPRAPHTFVSVEGGIVVAFEGICFDWPSWTSLDERWSSAAARMLASDPATFLSSIEGYYRGVIVDTGQRKLLLFVDHLSACPLYYSARDGRAFVGTDLVPLVRLMGRYGLSASVSAFGAYCMLSYSFIIGNRTPIEGVRKVPPATLLSLTDGKSFEYYTWIGQERHRAQSLSYVAEGLHQRFERAIERTFGFAAEHRQLLLLSGGLDSRMCLLYARKLGFDDISTLCYSQTGYREETIAREVAAANGCNHMFHSLDGGRYLSDIEEGVSATQGMTTYRPILSARSIWRTMDLRFYPLVHNGLLGDSIVGGYCVDKCNSDDRFSSTTNVALMLNPKNSCILSGPYGDEVARFFRKLTEWVPIGSLNSLGQEAFVLRNRYLNGLVQSYLGLRGLSFASLPFASRDVLEFVFSFPSSIRRDHGLYFKWMRLFAPEALRFRWENTGLRPAYGPFDVRPHSPVAEAARRIDRLSRRNAPEASRNPYIYWMGGDSTVMGNMVSYINERMHLLNDEPELLAFARIATSAQDIYCVARVATLLGLLSRCLGLDGGA